MNVQRLVLRCITLLMLLGPTLAHARGTVRVFAASSLTDVLSHVADEYASTTGKPAPELTFAGSSRLAQQAIHGAPADIVGLASPQWMDALERKGILADGSRVNLLENTLVIASTTQAAAGHELPHFGALAQAPWQRIAVAGEAVPAGIYARQALTKAGLAGEVQPRLVVAANVRAALALIQLGEVDAGFIYKTDAMTDPQVHILHSVSPTLHSPIVYPFALTEQGLASRDASAFLEYLQDSAATAHFHQAGFKRFGHPRTSKTLAPAPAPDKVSRSDVQHPLGVSLWVATISLLVSIIPAIGLGWLMARREFWGKSLVSTLLLTPLVLPPVVTGYLLLRLFGRNGWLAPLLEPLGMQIAFTRWGAVAAAATVGFPLLLILIRQAIESVDPRYPALAETLGLGPLQAFWRITLPMAMPGIAAGCALAFARALGEFGATAMIAGDQPGETRTLALAVYALSERPQGQETVVTLVWVSIAVSFVALLFYERLVWRQQRRMQEQG